MPGSNNRIHFSNGIRLEPSAAQEWFLMQDAPNTDDISMVNNDGTPEGVVPANMGSICFDRTNGDIYKKKTGTGNTGWEMLQSGASSDDYHVARYIVSAGGAADGANYTTIATAYAAAVLAGAPQTVFVQPGTYTENLTLTAGIDITACTGDNSSSAVNIVGKITATYAGSAVVSNIRTVTNGDYCVEVTGASATQLFLLGCNIAAADNDAIHCSNVNASISVRNSLFTPTVGFRNFVFSGGAHVFSFNNANGGSVTGATISAGSLIIKNSTYQSQIITSGTAELHLVNTQMGDNRTPDNLTMLICGGSGEHDADGCVFFSGNQAAITINSELTLTNSTIWSTAAPVMDGAGTLNYSNVAFGESSSINTTTQLPLRMSNDAIKVRTPGAYPYTVVGQDAVVLVNTASARTINLPAAPTSGEQHIIKDSVGSANSNTITIQGNGNNIDGAASITITTSYGSKSLFYNGTEWGVF